MSVRTHFGLACLGIAIWAPASTYAQAIAAPPPAHQTSQDATIATPEVTKRLDGRLFYSAQERQRLDSARKRGSLVGDTGSPFEVPPSVLNGFVKRSDGSVAVWVDGNVRWNAQGKNAASLVPSDVGGPAAYLSVITGGAVAAARQTVVRERKAAKLRAKAITAPRFLP
ncbi:MAG: hypothetical protein H7232_05965 [Aeromicrobium sp.]|nr:hypothetical protein [Burkholderiales bacterium]